MNIKLVDCDDNGFPNLALLKLSSYYRSKGDLIIEDGSLPTKNTKTFFSGVFLWSTPKYVANNSILGGVGFDPARSLPENIEHLCPDYTNLDYSLGFLSRGCIRKCEFCIVPVTEGYIKPHSLPQEFIRHKKAVFLDNNWLASPRWEQDWEWLYSNQIQCDFNQGLDSRLMDRQIAERLTKLHFRVWSRRSSRRSIRFACDSQVMKEPLRRTVKWLRDGGLRGEIFVYVLAKEVKEALDRIEFVRGLGAEPFTQPFRDFKTGETTRELRRLARWCNFKSIFRTATWEEYKKERGNRI